MKFQFLIAMSFLAGALIVNAQDIRIPSQFQGHYSDTQGIRIPSLFQGHYSGASCFDPRVVLFQCEEGTSFTGWDKGQCGEGLVTGAVCSECFDPRAVFIRCADGKTFQGWDIGQCNNGTVVGAICK
jgi:hypothetical protein